MIFKKLFNQTSKQADPSLRPLKKQSGQLLIELILAMGLLTLFLPAVLSVFVSSTSGRAQKKQRVEAANRLQEMQEALRVIRQKGWDQISSPGVYHTEIQSNSWELISDELEQEGFTHTIQISNVFRDNDFSIVASSHPEARLDPSTKKVEMSVSWQHPLASSVDSTFYFGRYLDNASLIDTSQADFDAGQFSDTTSKNDYGGEVILATGGHGDWCEPGSFIVEELDLDMNARSSVVRAIEGKAFTGTDWADQGLFSEINITQDDPPQANIADTISGYDTNDIFIDENYAYIATDNINRDVVIVDLNTNQEVGFFDDDFFLGRARGIFVKDNVGYATIGPYLHSFDLSDKSGERPELDKVWLSSFIWWPATGYKLQVVDSYAYVALDFGIGEMGVYDVSSPSSLDRVNYADVNAEHGVAVFVNQTGTRAYLATDRSGSKDELFIINTENQTGSLPVLASYDASGMDPRDLVIVSENKLLLAGLDGQEYQVIDVADDNNPVKCGGVDVNSGIYGVTGVLESDGDAYSYIVTKDEDAEFKIIEGGAGGGFTDSGEYVSEIFDAQYPVAFNYVLADLTEPAQTSIKYQVAVADAAAGSCAGVVYEFVGPDGTSGSFYDDEGPIVLDNDGFGFENPGQCFRYKVFFETLDQTSTPVLEEMMVNYSP